MSKVKFSILILFLFFLFSFVANAGNYMDGVLLRVKGDINVYFVKNNIKRWVSSLEVFNSRNFKWQDVKLVSKKEIATIKEGSPIILESVSPSPVSTSSPQVSVSASPMISVSPTPPPPAKINLQFPAPEYIRADWLTSHVTSKYGLVGQRIVFKYSVKTADKIENFRLYEKKPGDTYFFRIATFKEVPSTGCEDIDIEGEWMITEAGQCGYWSIQRVISPGGRDAIAYLPARSYLEGEYNYYVAGADKDGQETRPSGEIKLVFLSPVSILSPANNQQTKEIYPVFKWSIAGGWPANSIPDYFVMISDDKNAQNPLWTKQLKVAAGKTDELFVYDGPGLDSTKKYKTYIYGHYRLSEYDPDYISVPLNIPEFRVKSSNPWVSFVGGLKALFSGHFDPAVEKKLPTAH